MTALFTLLPEAVGTIRADDKAAILQLLAQRFAVVYGLDPVGVLERIEERERLGSTGFGRGVAIPTPGSTGWPARLPCFSASNLRWPSMRRMACRWT
jgi:hypothetical protein